MRFPLTLIKSVAAVALLAACSSPPSRPERPLPELFAAREAEEEARAQLAERLMEAFIQRVDHQARSKA